MPATEAVEPRRTNERTLIAEPKNFSVNRLQLLSKRINFMAVSGIDRVDPSFTIERIESALPKAWKSIIVNSDPNLVPETH
jgi:hypothetical protein